MEVRQLESIIYTLAADMPARVDLAYIRRLTELIAGHMNAEHAFIAKNGDDIVTFTQAYDFYYNKEFIGPIEYRLEHTPCDEVINENRICHHPIKVQEIFPHDEDLRTLKIQGYAGVPIIAPDTTVIGHLVLMSSKILTLSELQKKLLRLFSLKLAYVIERAIPAATSAAK